MTQKLTPANALLLLIPPLLWAGNAVVGRLINDQVPPVTLNLLRWLLAGLILLPLAWPIFRRGSGLWAERKRLALLGLLGISLFNAMQYLALKSSSPINVTLVIASTPVFMLVVGRLFFGAAASRRQWFGALLSIAGVLTVLVRGQWHQLLALKLVAGDVIMLLATLCWAFYSWLLTRGKDFSGLRRHWAHFLLAQIVYGLIWAIPGTVAEWSFAAAHIAWSGKLVAALLFVAIGPALLAFRCWGAGVERVGPNLAALFVNFTPLFAALLSSLVLGELPHLYHAAAFVMIVGGILWSASR